MPRRQAFRLWRPGLRSRLWKAWDSCQSAMARHVRFPPNEIDSRQRRPQRLMISPENSADNKVPDFRAEGERTIQPNPRLSAITADK
jgi:hypothetical protein